MAQTIELPYVLPHFKASSLDDVSVIAEHRFKCAIVSVTSKSDLKALRRLLNVASYVGTTLMPALALGPHTVDHLLNLIGDVLRGTNGSSVSLMLRASSKGEAETLLRAFASSRSLRHLLRDVAILWFDFFDGALKDESIAKTASWLFDLLKPSRICLSVGIPFGDVEASLRLLHDRFRNAKFLIALKSKANCRVECEPLRMFFPTSDQLKWFVYASALSGADGVIVSDACKLLSERVDLFKATAVASAEAQVTSRYWRGTPLDGFQVEARLQQTIDAIEQAESTDVRLCVHSPDGDELSELLITALRWFGKPSKLPEASAKLSINIRMGNMKGKLAHRHRVYMLRFPSPTRLRVRVSADALSTSVADFDIVDCLLISSHLPPVEEIHLLMNSLAAPVMQFEVQMALKEYESAKHLLSLLSQDVAQRCRQILNLMSEHVSNMLMAARRRHMARAIEHARAFRRCYRGMLNEITAVEGSW
jgi:hypothetical protein